VIDPPGVERGRTPLDAVDRVTLLQQHFGQKSAVLAGDAGDQRDPVAMAVLATAVPGVPIIAAVKAAALHHVPTSPLCLKPPFILELVLEPFRVLQATSSGAASVMAKKRFRAVYPSSATRAMEIADRQFSITTT
jgi:hypothetical protein